MKLLLSCEEIETTYETAIPSMLVLHFAVNSTEIKKGFTHQNLGGQKEGKMSKPYLEEAMVSFAIFATYTSKYRSGPLPL